jgi:type IV pilus assembly protein PilX
MSTKTQPTHQHASKGVVLIITLFIMALVTLTTLTSIRGTLIEEKLAGHARDRNKAQQAAEAALRGCLSFVINQQGTTILEDIAKSPIPAPNPPLWEVNNNWTNKDIFYQPTILDVNADVASAPKCIIENMDPSGGISYRITSRAEGGSNAAVVIMQATYTK